MSTITIPPGSPLLAYQQLSAADKAAISNDLKTQPYGAYIKKVAGVYQRVPASQASS